MLIRKGVSAFNNVIVLLPRRSAKKAAAMGILWGDTEIKAGAKGVLVCH